MIIDLSNSVVLKEFAKMSVIGNTKEVAQQIKFTLSHEAMIGFATELLWMYEDINDSRKLMISTHQLEVDPSPSQSIGFYLTPFLIMERLYIKVLKQWIMMSMRIRQDHGHFHVCRI